MQVNMPYIRACRAPIAEAGVGEHVWQSRASQNQRILLWKWFILFDVDLIYYAFVVKVAFWISGFLLPKLDTDPSAFSRHWPAPLNLSGHDTTDPGPTGQRPQSRRGSTPQARVAVLPQLFLDL